MNCLFCGDENAKWSDVWIHPARRGWTCPNCQGTMIEFTNEPIRRYEDAKLGLGWAVPNGCLLVVDWDEV